MYLVYIFYTRYINYSINLERWIVFYKKDQKEYYLFLKCEILFNMGLSTFEYLNRSGVSQSYFKQSDQR
jgi:hypothetical protein